MHHPHAMRHPLLCALCLLDADWCLRSDVVSDSRLQVFLGASIAAPVPSKGPQSQVLKRLFACEDTFLLAVSKDVLALVDPHEGRLLEWHADLVYNKVDIRLNSIRRRSQQHHPARAVICALLRVHACCKLIVLAIRCHDRFTSSGRTPRRSASATASSTRSTRMERASPASGSSPRGAASPSCSRPALRCRRRTFYSRSLCGSLHLFWPGFYGFLSSNRSTRKAPPLRIPNFSDFSRCVVCSTWVLVGC